MAWFLFNTDEDPTSPDSYTLITGTPSCSNGDKLCAIQTAITTGNKPVLDNSIKDDMLRALVGSSPTGSVKLKSI